MNNVVQTDGPLKFKVKMIKSSITNPWKLQTVLFSETCMPLLEVTL